MKIHLLSVCFFSLLIALVLSCGESTTESTKNGYTVTIENNHGHEMTITKDDVDAAVEKKYDVQGSAIHSHTITISSDNFKKLQTCEALSLTSSETLGHSHKIEIACEK